MKNTITVTGSGRLSAGLPVILGLLALGTAVCFVACDYFNRPLEPWIDEQYEKMRAIKDISISPRRADVSAGAAGQFTAHLNVRADAPRDVTWSVSGGGPGTAVSAGGLLTVASGETATALTVTATSVFDTGKSASAPVTVRGPYIVTFDPAGGTWSGGGGAPIASFPVNYGDFADVPGGSLEPPSGGFDFAGWHTTASGGSPVSFPYAPADNLTLYARWKYSGAVNSGASWAAAVTAAKAAAPGSFLINIGAASFPVTASGGADNPALSGAAGLNITLTGTGAISLSANGKLLDIPSGASFALDGPGLQGRSGNNAALVAVSGTFILQNGSISGNANTGSVPDGGGTISGNTAGSGGGVFISGTAALLTMSGGTITGNTAPVNRSGGGVYVNIGTFTIDLPAIAGTGGSVTGNTAGTGNRQAAKSASGVSAISGSANPPADGW